MRFGEDITLDDLKKHYNAVIFSTGAIRDADLDIPGIDAKGSYGAADFVSWFDGHPDVPREWPLEAESVAVIGNGNVALDVTRMLAKHADDLLPTEVPDNVYQGLKASPVTDVHVFGRRGPAQVKFTPLELRELGELRDVDMVVYDEDFDYDEASKTAIETNKQVKVIDRVLQQWRTRPGANNAGGEASRRLHLHFWAKPVEVVTDDEGRVAAFRYERTKPDAEGGVVGTGEIREVPHPGAVPRGRLLRLAPEGRPLRRAARRHPQPRGSGALGGLELPTARRLRHRLDQARSPSASSAHQVGCHGDGAPRHQ